MRTWARRDGDDYVINGSKTFITNGTRADFITLMLKTDPEAGHAGISIVIFPHRREGLSRLEEAQEGRQLVERHRRAVLRGLPHPAAQSPGRRGQGFRYLMQNFQSERLIGCASATSPGARLTLEEGIAYGRERVAFGKPIIKREVWQHKHRRPRDKLEAAEALTYRACDATTRALRRRRSP
jgi:citronellyl-CoA dehydrogenase